LLVLALLELVIFEFLNDLSVLAVEELVFAGLAIHEHLELPDLIAEFLHHALVFLARCTKQVILLLTVL